MREGRVRTLRGSFDCTSSGFQRQLILDDGLINRGYRVTGFFVWPTGGNVDGFIQAVLTMDSASTSAISNPEDNRQIAWFNSALVAGTNNVREYNYLDPDHVVVRDLVINADVEVDQNLAYMVVLREMSITDVEAIINIIKEDAQNIG